MSNELKPTQGPEAEATGEAATLVDDTELQPLKARPTLTDYLKQLWKVRFYIFQDARGKSFSEGRGMFLGVLWLVLNPAIQVGLYAFVFGFIMKAHRGVDNFIGFLIIGVIFFGFVNRGFTNGSLLIQKNRGLVTSFSFPKATIVLSAALRLTLDDIFPALLAVGAAMLTQWSTPPHVSSLLIVPLFILVHILTAGLSLILARLTAKIPDVNSLIQIITRILFFTSGVFVPVTNFVSHPTIFWILEKNPVYQFLDIARSLVLDGEIPPLGRWIYIFIVSIATFVIGLIFFWKAEHTYASVK